jgi:hypothetical protein
MQGPNLMTTIEQTVSLRVRSTEPHATGKAAYIHTYNFFTEVGQLIRGHDLKLLLEYGERPGEYGKLEKPGIRDGFRTSITGTAVL